MNKSRDALGYGVNDSARCGNAAKRRSLDGFYLFALDITVEYAAADLRNLEKTAKRASPARWRNQSKEASGAKYKTLGGRSVRISEQGRNIELKAT